METISMQTMRELEVALGLKGTRKSLVEEYAVLYAEYQRPPLVEVKKRGGGKPWKSVFIQKRSSQNSELVRKKSQRIKT